MDFETLKKNSGTKSIEQLNEELEKTNKNNYDEDTRYWTPTVDKAGNGSAIIRFMPAPPGETLPWVVYYDHGFEGPGGWYIEKSLTTIGKDDPVSEHNSELWKSGLESNKKLVSNGINGKNGQKRRKSLVSNIYVVNDPARPECNGNTYLYRYGAKIFDKINVKMHPEFEGEVAVNPFDFWEGANFKLRIRKVEGQTNYDRSEFDSSEPLLKDDEKLKAIWNKLYSLKEIISPDKFKTYEELKTRLCKVLGDQQPTSVHVIASREDHKTVEPKVQKEKVSKYENKDVEELGLDSDTEEFFKNLRED